MGGRSSSRGASTGISSASDNAGGPSNYYDPYSWLSEVPDDRLVGYFRVGDVNRQKIRLREKEGDFSISAHNSEMVSNRANIEYYVRHGRYIDASADISVPPNWDNYPDLKARFDARNKEDEDDGSFNGTFDTNYPWGGDD